MGQCKISRMVPEKERLHILYPAPSGCRVAHMAYSHAAGKGRQLRSIENFRHKALTLDPPHTPVRSCGNYAATLLPPVLQGMEGIICQVRGIRYTPDAEYSAFFIQTPAVHAYFPLK